MSIVKTEPGAEEIKSEDIHRFSAKKAQEAAVKAKDLSDCHCLSNKGYKQKICTQCGCSECTCICKIEAIEPRRTEGFTNCEVLSQQTSLNQIESDTDVPSNDDNNTKESFDTDLPSNEDNNTNETNVPYYVNSAGLEEIQSEETDTCSAKKAQEAGVKAEDLSELHYIFNKGYKQEICTQSEFSECTYVCKIEGIEPHRTENFTNCEMQSEHTGSNKVESIDIDLPANYFNNGNDLNSAEFLEEEKISISDIKVDFPDSSSSFPETNINLLRDIKEPKITFNDVLLVPWSGPKLVLKRLTVPLADLNNMREEVASDSNKTATKRKMKTFVCDKSSYTAKHHSSVRKQTSAHNKQYSCDSCLYKTARRDHFDSHQLSHSSVDQYRCKFCLKNFRNKRRLDSHLYCMHSCEITDSEKMLLKVEVRECPFCKYKTIHSSTFAYHMRAHHPNSRTQRYICPKCNYVCFSRSVLSRHVRTHLHLKPFACTHCDSTFNQEKNFESHLLNIHKNLIPNINEVITRTIHKCRFCEFQTVFSYQLMKHLLAKHKNENGIISTCQCDRKRCKKCSLARTSRCILNQKGHVCNFCEMAFHVKKQLDEHLLAKHKDESNFVEVFDRKIHYCEICLYQTLRPGLLSQHMGAKHKKSNKPKFICNKCGFETYRKTNLIRHLPVHSKVKQLSCKSCGVEFTSKGYLDSHIFYYHKDNEDLMKSISIRIYECFNCFYTTSYSKILDSHIKNGCRNAHIK